MLKFACVRDCVDAENSRQKFFNRGGFTFKQRGLTFKNLTKTPLIYTVSYYNLGMLQLILGGQDIKPAPG